MSGDELSARLYDAVDFTIGVGLAVGSTIFIGEFVLHSM